ncbi:MAG: N,N-dimethylformamidase beta subunit family domain-containing protein, partial [Mucilaginibacter sp.]
MKLPAVNRRSFIGSFLAILAFIGCKKPFSVNKSTDGLFKDPLAANPNFDLGTYTVTELGGELYQPEDISKIFHGYTDKISYKSGETVSLFLSGPPSSNQVITLSDVNGKVVLSFTTAIDFQTIGTMRPWLSGFMYDQTTSIKLPDDLKSGFYRFTGDIPIICKGNTQVADVTVVYPSNTFNAYCYNGGKSLYKPGDAVTEYAIYRATVVSFLRYDPVTAGAAGNFIESFFEWMPGQNYNTRYVADIDLEDYREIENSKVIILTGKSEYWTRRARTNFDRFVASGKNALILSGNTMYWQVRYNMKKKVMICYKSNNVDPLGDTLYSTYYWDTPGLGYPVRSSIGADFTSGGYPMKVASPLKGFKIAREASPLLKGTGLKNGDLLHLPTVETDGAPVKKMVLPGSAEIPEIDNSKLNFHKVELIAYTFTLNPDSKPGLGTFIVFQ